MSYLAIQTESVSLSQFKKENYTDFMAIFYGNYQKCFNFYFRNHMQESFVTKDADAMAVLPSVCTANNVNLPCVSLALILITTHTKLSL